MPYQRLSLAASGRRKVRLPIVQWPIVQRQSFLVVGQRGNPFLSRLNDVSFPKIDKNPTRCTMPKARAFPLFQGLGQVKRLPGNLDAFPRAGTADRALSTSRDTC